MSEMLKRLLGSESVADLPGVRLELPRLSRPGAPFVLNLRPLTWKQLGDLRAGDGDDAKLKIILAACPDLGGRIDPADTDPEHGILTAEDALRAKLLPGEIDRIVDAVDRLCGYRGADAVKEIKN